MKHINDLVFIPSTTADAISSDGEAAAVCALCGGTGYIGLDAPVGHPHFGKFELCQCRLAARAQQQRGRLAALSNVVALRDRTFETFVPDGYGLAPTEQRSLQVAFDLARHFAQKPDGWLVFVGGPGVGKTHLAAAIANTALDANQPVIFVVVADLLDHLRAAFGPSSETSYDERFDEIRDTGLLILDDLGTHSATPWAEEKLFQLINYRYQKRRPTAITANTLSTLHPNTQSRLHDTSLVRQVHITAPDFRRGVRRTSSDLSQLTRYTTKTFSAFESRSSSLAQALAIAQQFAATPQNWLVLRGTYRAGKTHLAAAIAHARATQGEAVIFTTVPDLLDQLQASYKSNTYDQRLDEVRRVPLLVLDDLGAENQMDWRAEKLYQIFTHRDESRLPTVVTLAPEAKLSARLQALVDDTHRCTVLDLSPRKR